MKKLTFILLYVACLTGQAQNAWTVDQCMQYAVTHNHEVRLQSIALDDYKTEKVRAVGSFLPDVEGSISGQYNFGRAIDPETNTYTNVSTFYNGYGVSVGIPVFDGFQRYNNLRAAKANVLMGKSQLMAQKDATAQKVLETYTLALYYKGCIEFATQKRAESEMLLRQTKVMAEVGQKGEADVAQMQATYAADDYEVTHQQGLYDNTILMLKQLMNYQASSLTSPIGEDDFEIAPLVSDETNNLFINTLDTATETVGLFFQDNPSEIIVSHDNKEKEHKWLFLPLMHLFCVTWLLLVQSKKRFIFNLGPNFFDIILYRYRTIIINKNVTLRCLSLTNNIVICAQI